MIIQPTRTVIPNMCKNRLCKARLQEDSFNFSTTDKTVSVRISFLKHFIIAHLVSVADNPLSHWGWCWSRRWLSQHNHSHHVTFITVTSFMLQFTKLYKTRSSATVEELCDTLSFEILAAAEQLHKNHTLKSLQQVNDLKCYSR